MFRFLKLPIELRFKVYDLTISSDKVLRHEPKYKPSDLLTGLQLRGTCRQVHDETYKFFWRNSFTFYAGIKDKISKRPIFPILTENLRDFTWESWGHMLKDTLTLRMLKDFDGLEILRVRFTNSSLGNTPVPGGPAYHYHQVNDLHQFEPAVAKFKYIYGLDDLFRLRGLTTVIVTNDTAVKYRRIPSDVITDAEFKAFEAFLTSEITKPKAPKV